ncbi:MAG: cadherin-like domain-containing protein, partial [Chthoniobacteraceae bacterium]
GSGVSNAGIQLTTSATITAGGGNISLTGTGGGGAASNTNRGLQLQNSGVIAATGNGTVTLIGIGGGGTGNSHGTRIVQNASVTAVNGNISITGSVMDGTTASQGFTLSNAAAVGAKVETSGSAAITVAADTMDISTSGVTVNAGSNTVTLRQKTNAVAINLGSAVDTTPSTLELAQGELNVITAGTVQIGDANSGAISISAIISPANYRTLGIGNNVSFSGTGGFSSDIGPTAADIEKITVSGTVTIAPAAQLTLAATGGFVPVNGQSFPIITNDLADAISGTFFAYSEGGSIPAFLGSGITAQVTYLGGTGNDLVILTNRPPVPGVVTASRYPTQPVKLPVAQILAVATDPDLGDTISLLSVANGANGTAQIAGGYVIYTPTGNFPISHTFTYVLQDNHGATATGTVTVNVLTDNAPTNNITKFTKIAGSPAVVDFVGIPGFTYGVQYKLALADPTWLDIGPLTMNAFGAAQFTDNGPGSAPRTAAASGFYRFIYPAP